MTHLSLFAGIGGIDLGLARAGSRCVGMVEIDPFCRAVLAKNFPGVPLFQDVRSFDARAFAGSVDLVAGGFPCQDISVAGKGAGIDGARSGLWSEMLRIVREVRPAWVLAENVPALRTRGADRVLGDLEGEGYACWPLLVGAGDVGAPHRRQRVWIVGRLEYANGRRLRREQDAPAVSGCDREADGLPENPSSQLAVSGGERGQEGLQTSDTPGLAPAARGGDESDRVGEVRRQPAFAVALSTGARREEPGREHAGPFAAVTAPSDVARWPARPGQPQHEWEAPRLVELPLGGAVDGVPARLVRAANRHALRAYGNSVVPQVVELVGRVIVAAHVERERRAVA